MGIKLPLSVEKIYDDNSDNIATVIRGSSRLSKSLALIMLVFGVTMCTIVYASKDTIVRLFEINYEVDHLKRDHDHCHSTLAALQDEVADLRNEVLVLKEKLSIAIR